MGAAFLLSLWIIQPAAAAPLWHGLIDLGCVARRGRFPLHTVFGVT